MISKTHAFNARHTESENVGAEKVTEVCQIAKFKWNTRIRIQVSPPPNPRHMGSFIFVQLPISNLSGISFSLNLLWAQYVPGVCGIPGACSETLTLVTSGSTQNSTYFLIIFSLDGWECNQIKRRHSATPWT